MKKNFHSGCFSPRINQNRSVTKRFCEKYFRRLNSVETEKVNYLRQEFKNLHSHRRHYFLNKYQKFQSFIQTKTLDNKLPHSGIFLRRKPQNHFLLKMIRLSFHQSN